MDAHLLFEAAAARRIARAERAVVIDEEFRHHEQRDALDAFRRAFDAGEHKVNDVLGQVLLAAGNPDLLAGDLVGAIALRHGFRLHQAEVGAAMRLGQVHRAGPFGRGHLWAVLLLQLIRAARHQRLVGAVRQAGIHAERHVRGRDHLGPGDVDRMRQALPAHFRMRRQQRPAILDELFVGLREPVRRLHARIGIAFAALPVADGAQREQYVLGELRALFEDLVDRLGGRVGKARKVRIILELQHLVQHKLHVTDGGVITGHRGKVLSNRKFAALNGKACWKSHSNTLNYLHFDR